MIRFVMIYLFSVFVSSISQILLKISTKKEYDNLIKEYLNPKVLFAYVLFFFSSLLTVYAYKYVPLSMGPVLESSGYIFVAVLGYIYLHEYIGKKKILGLTCILIGIAISCL